MLFSSTKRCCAANHSSYLWSRISCQSYFIFYARLLFALLLACGLSTAWGVGGGDDSSGTSPDTVVRGTGRTEKDGRKITETHAEVTTVGKCSITTSNNSGEEPAVESSEGSAGIGNTSENSLKVPVCESVVNQSRPPETVGSPPKQDNNKGGQEDLKQRRKSVIASPHTSGGAKSSSSKPSSSGTGGTLAKSKSATHTRSPGKEPKSIEVYPRARFFETKRVAKERESYIKAVATKVTNAGITKNNEIKDAEKTEVIERISKLEQQIVSEDGHAITMFEKARDAAVAGVKDAGNIEMGRLQCVMQDAKKTMAVDTQGTLKTFQADIAEVLEAAKCQQEAMQEDWKTVVKLGPVWDQQLKFVELISDRSDTLVKLVAGLSEKSECLRGLSRENKIGSFKTLFFSDKLISYDRDKDALKNGFRFPVYGAPEGWGLISSEDDAYRFIHVEPTEDKDKKTDSKGIRIECNNVSDEPLKMCYMAKMQTEGYRDGSYLMAKVSYSVTRHQSGQEDGEEAQHQEVDITFYDNDVNPFKGVELRASTAVVGETRKIDKWVKLENPKDRDTFYVGLDIKSPNGIIVHDIGLYEWSVEQERLENAMDAFHLLPETFDKRVGQFVRSYSGIEVTNDTKYLQQALARNGGAENELGENLDLWSGSLRGSKGIVWNFENDWFGCDGNGNIRVSTYKKSGDTVDLIFYRKDML